MRAMLSGLLLAGCGVGDLKVSDLLSGDALLWGSPDLVCLEESEARCWEFWLEGGEASEDEAGWCGDYGATLSDEGGCPDGAIVGLCDYSIYEGYRTLTVYYGDSAEAPYTEDTARSDCGDMRGEFTSGEAE